MKLSWLPTALAVAAWSAVTEGRAIAETEVVELLARALPANAPHGYTPQTNACPSTLPKIRDASSLSSQETSWLSNRRKAIRTPMKNLLQRMNITGLDTNAYIDNLTAAALPAVGIAVSGGGYRAMLNGAGVLQAFDSRTAGSTATGQLGGLLQSTTYLSALSGGGWLVGSLYTNNFSTVSNILKQNGNSPAASDLWQFENSILEGPDASGLLQVFSSAKYYAQLVSDVEGKKDAGFNVSITDYWGRALSYQLVNASNGGPSYTFSSIADQDWFSSGTAPVPLLVADSRAPGEIIPAADGTIYTFSPWELGSDDPTVYAFAPLKYVGTNFTAGTPATKNCVTGFDNVGFVMGTSSSLFNAAFEEVNGTSTTGLFSSLLQDALEALAGGIGKSNYDISVWRPNPFYHYNAKTNRNANDTQLTLVDGGEDNQNIPFHPLIQPNRNLDVIFAVDSSADTNATFPTTGSAQNWPGGLALEATYQRSFLPIANGTSFPKIPSTNTIFNLGLNNRPTFFGCNSTTSPLIVYLPNAPYTTTSNVSTFDLSYPDSQRDALVANGYALATQLNATLNAEWPACVGCAVLKRSLEREGRAMPAVCERCFERYCWNGTVDDSAPANYVPALKGK